MFSKKLIEYTQQQFSKPDLSMRLNTTVKQVNQKDIVVMNNNKELEISRFFWKLMDISTTPKFLEIVKQPPDVW